MGNDRLGTRRLMYIRKFMGPAVSAFVAAAFVIHHFDLSRNEDKFTVMEFLANGMHRMSAFFADPFFFRQVMHDSFLGKCIQINFPGTFLFPLMPFYLSDGFIRRIRDRGISSLFR